MSNKTSENIPNNHNNNDSHNGHRPNAREREFFDTPTTANPQKDTTQNKYPNSLENLESSTIEQKIKTDAALITSIISKMSQEDFEKLAVKQKSWKPWVYNMPDAKEVGTEELKELIGKHEISSRFLTLLAGVFSAGVGAAASPFANIWASKVVGAGITAAGYGVIQKTLKETALENLTYSQARLIPTYKHQIGEVPKEKTLSDFWSKKRMVSLVGINVITALLASSAALFEVNETDHREMMQYKVDELSSGISSNQKKDTEIIQKIKELEAKIRTNPNDVQSQIELVKAKASSPILALYSEQVKLEEKLKNCESTIKPDSKTKKEPDTSKTAYQDCATFIGGVYYKDKPRGVPGYKTSTDDLKKRIESKGGEYREGEMPSTPANRQKELLEAVRADNPKETILKYYERINQAEYGVNLVKEIESGSWFSDKIGPIERIKIGSNRVNRVVIVEHQIPAEIINTILIFVIELVAVYNTMTVLTNKNYQRIFINGEVQDFAQRYNFQLAKEVYTILNKRSGSDDSTNVNLRDRAIPNPTNNSETGDNDSIASNEPTYEQIHRLVKNMSLVGLNAGLMELISSNNQEVFGTVEGSMADQKVQFDVNLIEINDRNVTNNTGDAILKEDVRELNILKPSIETRTQRDILIEDELIAKDIREQKNTNYLESQLDYLDKLHTKELEINDTKVDYYKLEEESVSKYDMTENIRRRTVGKNDVQPKVEPKPKGFFARIFNFFN